MSLRPIWRRLKRSPSRRRDPSPQTQTANEGQTRPATPAQSHPVKALPQVDDLWTTAEKDLRDDPQQSRILDNAASVLEQRGLNVGTGDSRSHQQLCSFLEAKSQALEEKKWMIGDHEIASKAQLVKIFQHVLMVKDIVNTAASMSPPAAIACAGLTVTLTLFIQSATEQRTLIDGLGKTSALIPRIYEMQKLYLRSQPDVNLTESYMPQVTKVLTAICRKVLEFHARALCYFDKSSVTHTFRGMFKQDPWSDLIRDMQSLESEAEKFTRLIDAAETKSGWRKWTERDEELQQKIEAQQVWQTSQAQDQKITEFLRRLYTCPYRDRKDRNRERVLGTCEWFTGHDLFTKWNTSQESCLLWVSADPGCGKSVLTKYLVDKVLPSPDRTICYFFFKDDFSDQRTATSAVSSLLRQLIISHPSLLTESILEKAERDGNKLIASLPDLWDMLISIASSQQAGEISIVIDALDECSDDERNQLIKMVKGLYLRSDHTSNLKLLITSRPYGHIRSGFRRLEDRLPTIHLSGESGKEADQIATEINLVVESMTREIADDKDLDDDERHFLEQQLKPIPNRTYLWVTLTLGYIKETDGFTKGNVRRALGASIPPSVNDAYEKILDRSPNHAKARIVLHMILAAERPLSLHEISIALAVQRANQPDEEVLDEMEPVERFKTTVRDLCGLLLWISDDKVYLLHQTLKEFLTPLDTRPDVSSSSPCVWERSFAEMESNRVVGKRCMWALTSDLSESSFADFLVYASTYWDEHVRKFLFSNTETDEDIVDLVVSLCTVGSEAHKRSVGLYKMVRTSWAQPWTVDGTTSLIIAAYFGVTPAFRRLLATESVTLNSVDANGSSPLSWASQRGHAGVVELLLETGRVDVHSRDASGVSAPSLASDVGQLRIMKPPLATDQVDVDSRDEKGRTPLSYSSENGHFDIVRLLLATGQAVIDSRDQNGRTPMSYASGHNHLEIVKLLLSTGQVEVDSRNEQGVTPFSYASSGGHLEIVKLLIATGQVEVDSKDEDRMTPFLHASRNGRLEMMKLLLATGQVKANSRDKYGRSSLIYASIKGNLEIVKLLVATSEVEFDFEDKHARSSFMYAAMGGHSEMMKLLLATGQVEVDSRDNDRRSPLLHASMGNHLEAMKLLLATGQVEVDSRDIDERSPLSHASLRGCLGTVELLLATGQVDVNSRDYTGATPLIHASRRGAFEIVKLFLNTGTAEIQIEDHSGGNAVSYAFECAHFEVVNLLNREIGKSVSTPAEHT